MTVMTSAPLGVIEGRTMLQVSRQSLARAIRCTGARSGLLLAMATLVAMPLPAQGGRRGLEPRGAPAAAAAPNGGFGTYHAVIFAVGEQQPGLGSLASLKFPLKEADSLRAVITREYMFDPKNVQLIRNPTRTAILDTLAVLARRLGPQDNLLVIYSGHGGFDEAAGEGYWLATDAADSRPSTWISNGDIRSWLRKLRARSVLLITDACFSGSISKGGGEGAAELAAEYQSALTGALIYANRSSRQAMTAGTAKETVPQISVFSLEIVAALKRRRAPFFLAQQLAAEVNPRVASVARTTPTFSAVPGIESDQGDFVFVRRNAFASVDAAVVPTIAQHATAPVAGMQRGGTQPLAASGAAATRPSTPAVSAPVSAPIAAAPRPGGEGALAGGRSGANVGSKVGNIGSAPVVVPGVASGSGTGNGGGNGSGNGSGNGGGNGGSTGLSTSRAAPGCDGGMSAGCITLAQNLEYGRNGVAPNGPRAVGLYRLACDARDPDACMHLGRMYDSRHDGVSMDRGRARTLFAQACDGGSAAACTYIGLATAKGEGAAADAAKAAMLYAKACDGGHLQGCGLLGIAYSTATGAPQSDTRAAPLLQRACTGGEARACGELGVLHASARGGLTRDSVKAVALWRQGCTAFDVASDACAWLGAAYLRGSGVSRDDGRAVQYLSQGCEGGFAPGCTMLAGVYEAGSTVTAKSVTRAATFYKRACDAGEPRACAWIRANPQPPAK